MNEELLAPRPAGLSAHRRVAVICAMCGAFLAACSSPSREPSPRKEPSPGVGKSVPPHLITKASRLRDLADTGESCWTFFGYFVAEDLTIWIDPDSQCSAGQYSKQYVLVSRWGDGFHVHISSGVDGSGTVPASAMQRRGLAQAAVVTW